MKLSLLALGRALAGRICGAAAAITAAVAMTACGSSDDFIVRVKVDDDMQRMVVMTYATASGIKRELATVDNGEATLRGVAPTYTMASLAWSDGEPLAKCIVRNGDKLTVAFEQGSVNPVVSGSEPTRLLNGFIADNAAIIASGNVDSLAAAVGRYVADHTADPSAVVVMIDYLDLKENAAMADSLLEMIDPEARPASLMVNYGVANGEYLNSEKLERIYPFGVYTTADSLVKIRPNDARMTLLAFLSTSRPVRRRQVDRLRTLARGADSLGLRIVELSGSGDSVAWRVALRGDSASWTQAWAPGGSASTALRRMAVPREPFFILIDSTGWQRFRGSDLSAAIDAIRSRKP